MVIVSGVNVVQLQSCHSTYLAVSKILYYCVVDYTAGLVVCDSQMVHL
jgi:hypothetical protein